MKDFHHCHVMKLIGICIGQDQLPLVILPFMENGDLLTYLRDPKNVCISTQFAVRIWSMVVNISKSSIIP